VKSGGGFEIERFLIMNYWSARRRAVGGLGIGGALLIDLQRSKQQFIFKNFIPQNPGVPPKHYRQCGAHVVVLIIYNVFILLF
jgi:hypothetical protein